MRARAAGLGLAVAKVAVRVPQPRLALQRALTSASSSSSSSSSSTTATITATTTPPPKATSAATKPIPQSGRLRSLYDVIFGGYFNQGLSVEPLFRELHKRHQSDVFAVDFGTGQPIYVLLDPDDFMAVLRAEWSVPRGAAATQWPLVQMYADLGYTSDNPDPTKRNPFAFEIGEPWKAGRHLYQIEMFRTSSIDQYVPVLGEVAKDAVKYLEKNKGKMTLEDFCNKVAFEMVASVLLGQRMGLLTDTSTPLTRQLVTNALATFRLIGPLTTTSMEKGKKTPEWKQVLEHWRLTLEAGLELVKQSESSEADSVVSRVRGKNKKLAAEHISSDMASLLAAGVDTTSNVMQNCLWALARYPHTQQRLREEVQAKVGSGPITAEALADMPYLKAFSREQHRLHYAATATTRILADEPVAVPSGYTLPPRTMVMAYSYLYHTDPKHIHGDPNLFLPERWLDKAGGYDRNKGGGVHASSAEATAAATTTESASPTPGEKLSVVSNYQDLNTMGPNETKKVDVFAPSLKVKHALFETPFGLGPRQCIGGRLATAEIHVLMTELVRSFKLTEPNKNTKVREVLFRQPYPDPAIKYVPV